MGWFTFSVISGILSGIGMILARSAVSAGMSSYMFVGLIGLVWAVATGGTMIIRHESMLNIATFALLTAIIAGIFFWMENVLRYKAITMTPVIAYTLMTIVLTSTLVTLGYDITQMYRSGTLSTINLYQLAGLVFAIIALVLFNVGSK